MEPSVLFDQCADNAHGHCPVVAVDVRRVEVDCNCPCHGPDEGHR